MFENLSYEEYKEILDQKWKMGYTISKEEIDRLKKLEKKFKKKLCLKNK